MICYRKPYPAMKDSGVPWLGEVPEHWEMLPNRAIFMEIKEREYPEEQMLSVTITKGVIPQQKLLADSSKKDSSNQDKSAYKVVRPGDIAYNKMRAWQGAIGASDHRGIVSPAYVVQRPRDGAHPRYFHYLLRMPSFAKEAERWSYGITSDMWSLRPEHFKMIYGCVPPLPEQAAIVRFLDYMDRRIRKYIHAKQKLIKLLEEQKQSIIHRAVTRGLDPNVRLKPSGVAWLGEVPEHWEVRKLKRLAKLNPSRSETAHLRESSDLATFLPMERVSTRGEVDASLRLPIRDLWQGFTYFRRGDVLLAKITPCFENGKGGCLMTLPTEVGFGTTEFIVLRAGRAIRPEFLYQVIHLAVFRSIGVESMTGSAGQQRVSQNFVATFEIPVPPLSEQAEILQGLLEGARQIDSAIARAIAEISLLREYRTRLIADVVTGKLDVREVAANLPEEAKEPELSNDIEALTEGDGDSAELDAVPEEADA